MDILTITLIYFIVLVIAFVFFILWITNSKNNKVKGRNGELGVEEELNKLDHSEYLTINDIHVGESQIDHIVVSRYGIFIIETKNWSGSIYGRGWDKNWKQYVQGIRGPISRPSNPVYQNKRHIISLRNFLHEYPNLSIIPIIVVSGNTERNIYKDPCIKISELIEKIFSYKEPVISSQIRDEIYQKLSHL